MTTMTKNLESLLQSASALKSRIDDLTSQRGGLREQKEKVIEAAEVDDRRAFDKVDDLSTRERMLTIAIEKAQRELAGMGVRLLNEAGHVQKSVCAKLKALKEAEEAGIKKALVSFYGTESTKAFKDLPASPLRLKISKHLGGLGARQFNPAESDETEYARQMLGSADRAIEALALY